MRRGAEWRTDLFDRRVSRRITAGDEDYPRQVGCITPAETTESVPEDSIFMATDTVRESTTAALATANKWLSEAPVKMETEKSKSAGTASDEDQQSDD